MNNLRDVIQEIIIDVYKPEFQEWVRTYESLERRFIESRTHLERLENLLQRLIFSQATEGRHSQKIFQQRFAIIESAGIMDEMERPHDTLLEKVEECRSRSTRIWEKITAEEIKTKPNEKSLEKLKDEHSRIQSERERLEAELKNLWNEQCTIKFRKEVLYWKAVRIQKAAEKYAAKTTRQNERIDRIKKRIDEVRRGFESVQTDFVQHKKRLPALNRSVEVVEHFVCFPIDHYVALFSLIDDNSLFPILVERNKMYFLNMHKGFGSLRSIEVDDEEGQAVA